MFKRTEKRQDQGRQQVPEVRGPQAADPSEIGNEALAHYLENDIKLTGIGSKKRKNGPQDEEDQENAAGTVLTLINEIAEKEPDALTENIIKEPAALSENAGKKQENLNVPEEIAGEGLSHYYMADIKRHLPKAGRAKKKNKESGNIMNDSLISEKNSLKEPDLLSVGSRRSSLSVKGGKSLDASENIDLNEARDDMAPVDGWDFAAQKLDPKSAPSLGKKLASAAAYQDAGQIAENQRY